MMDWNHGISGAAAAPVLTPDYSGDVSRIAALMASVPRPGVLVSERELSVLRRGLTKDGWKRSLYLQPSRPHPHVYEGAGIMSIANRALEMDASIPERGGHYHKFFCECGTRLSIPDDLQPAAQYSCPSCGSVCSGEDRDGAVRYLRHQRLVGAVLSLAIVYSIEKDRAYADKAAEILRNYALAYPGPHTDHVTGGILHQSLCEAVWVIPLAQAYDLIYYSRSLNEEDKGLIEDRLFRPVARGLIGVGIAGNWGSWHLSAVGVIGFAIKDASLVSYALKSFGSQIAEQLGDDGLWPESVHTYHFYALRAFVHFAEACQRAGIDIYNWEPRPGKSLRSMFAAPVQYAYPSLRLPAINDGWFDSFMPLDLYEIAFRRWNDPLFAWVLKRGYRFAEAPINADQREHPEAFRRDSFYAFLFGRDLPGRVAPPPLKSHDFGRVGICTLRNGDDVMATLHYGPFLGHGHLDKLSFTLYANDRLLVPDYGTPGYGSGILSWYTGTSSHNTVVVDGESQQRSNDYGLTTHYRGEFVQLAEAVARDHYPGVKQTRRVLLVGHSCFVMDVLESDSEHDYDWLVRCEGRLKPVGRYRPWDLDMECYPLIALDRAYRADYGFAADLECEKRGLAFAMWAGNMPFDVGVGTCPAETAARRVPIIVCRQRGRSATFIALFAASRAGKPDVSADGGVIRIDCDGAVDHIFLKETGVEDQHALLQTDGDVALVRVREGDLQSIALVNGSWVRWMGEHLIECPSRVACVEVSLTERNPLIRYCCDTCGVVKLRTNARAMRINGHKTAAANTDGQALLRVTSQMLASDVLDFRS
jgi:hypothetical protein